MSSSFFVQAFSILVIAASMAGCVSTRYAPLYADSPSPVLDNVPLCTTDVTGNLIPLPPDHQCLALVVAGAWYSRTNLKVKEGEKYRITLPEGQAWFDASNRHASLQGDKGSLLMNQWQNWKRHVGLWFALYGAIIPIEPKSPDATQLVNSKKFETELMWQNLGDNPVFSAAKDGELVFYPNDAAPPFIWRRAFYANNHGQIWVIVKHCDTCANAP